MEVSKIRELAQLMHQEELTCLEYETGDERIRLECGNKHAPSYPPMYLPEQVPGGTAVAPSPGAALEVSGAAPADANVRGDLGMDYNDLNVVTSPMVGVFYCAPAEDQPPYVQVGDKVKQGDILCIVEAMKVMNEITADCDGEIVDICVRNEEVVEFGQALFKLI